MHVTEKRSIGEWFLGAQLADVIQALIEDGSLLESIRREVVLKPIKSNPSSGHIVDQLVRSVRDVLDATSAESWRYEPALNKFAAAATHIVNEFMSDRAD